MKMVINNMKQLPDPGLDYWANKSHEAAIPYIFLAGDPKQIACTYIYRLPYVEKLIATKAVREWSDALQERSGSHWIRVAKWNVCASRSYASY